MCGFRQSHPPPAPANEVWLRAATARHGSGLPRFRAAWGCRSSGQFRAAVAWLRLTLLGWLRVAVAHGVCGSPFPPSPCLSDAPGAPCRWACRLLALPQPSTAPILPSSPRPSTALMPPGLPLASPAPARRCPEATAARRALLSSGLLRACTSGLANFSTLSIYKVHRTIRCTSRFGPKF